MVVVDASVWIDHFNGVSTPAVAILDSLADSELIIGDIVMVEVLQGFRTETDFQHALGVLAALEFRPMVGREVGLAAARNHRTLREKGITIRKTIDTIIASFCILGEHGLLHSDRDFEPFERHLGLQVLK